MRAADAFRKRRQQIPCAESRQSTCKAEDTKLRVCHAVGIDVDLNAKSHEVDLPEYTRDQGVEKMRPLVNEVVGGECCQNTDVLSCSF